MCRSQADGGRRCPGHSQQQPSPPADGKTRIAVVTNKRSYTVIGGQSRVTWMPGERVESMDVIEPTAVSSPVAAASPTRPQHVYCYCVGWHKQGCANYGVPDAMPAFIPDKGDAEYAEYAARKRA